MAQKSKAYISILNQRPLQFMG